MDRKLKLLLGILALVSTIAVVGFSAALASQITVKCPERTASTLSASLQGAACVVLVYFVWTIVANSFTPLLKSHSPKSILTFFTTGVLVCAAGAAASVVNILIIVNTTRDVGQSALGIPKNAFIISCSIVLGVSAASQIAFLSVFIIGSRQLQLTARTVESLSTEGDSSITSIGLRVKSVPYEKTRPLRSNSMDSGVCPSMTSDTRPSSLRSNSSRTVHHAPSKTRLVNTRERRLPSLDSNAYRCSGDGSSESWDPTSIDVYARRGTTDNWSPPHTKSRFLETIPASPTVDEVPGRTSSPGLEPPPPVRQRSRSYSPVRRPEIENPGDEANIHPLFRSDSPTPPPMATPETSVVAAPEAGSILRNPSHVTVRRIRSGSLPSVSSPLSRQSSLDAISLKKIWDEQDSIREVDEEEEEEEREHQTALSPPIPKWVLSADNRSSMTEYHTRRLRGDQDGTSKD
jgi:hypothetical protein